LDWNGAVAGGPNARGEKQKKKSVNKWGPGGGGTEKRGWDVFTKRI